MGNNIEIGNLDELNIKHPKRKDWILGDFVKESELRKTDKCEVKWSNFHKGEKKISSVNSNEKERTLAILISGKCKIKFSDGREYVLSKPGDYIVHKTMPHCTEVIEQSRMLAIRWKEI